MNELKEIMDALARLRKENLISEKQATTILENYLQKRHQKKQEEINRLNP